MTLKRFPHAVHLVLGSFAGLSAVFEAYSDIRTVGFEIAFGDVSFGLSLSW